MKKKSFKYALGERVFILGRTGICEISGRGHMEFISGGNMPWYSLVGAYVGLQPENILITPQEAHILARN
jgi:hypothetical protein